MRASDIFPGCLYSIFRLISLQNGDDVIVWVHFPVYFLIYKSVSPARAHCVLIVKILTKCPLSILVSNPFF